MAYSNWGGFIWNKDVELTERYADTSFKFKDGRWIPNDYKDDEVPVVGGHIVLPLADGQYLLECYKTYVVLHRGTEIIDLTEELSYEFEDFSIDSYYIDDSESIRIITVSKRIEGQIYFIICGMSVGKGYEKTPMSKYLKKDLRYWRQEKSYMWQNWEVLDEAIDHMKRKYERQHIRQWLFKDKRNFIVNLKKLYYLR